MTTDWKTEYIKVVAREEEGNGSAEAPEYQQNEKTQGAKVIAFLDLLLEQEGGEWWKTSRQRLAKKSDGQKVNVLTEEDKKQLKMLKTRLAAIGTELLVKLPELNTSVSRNDARSVKMRVLQLQVVCRLLRYGALKSMEKKEKKLLKKEIRGLLDRVALLLDAANPPSLADEDTDDRSPFQQFLKQQLGPRLRLLLPKLVQYLYKIYELQDEDGDEENRVEEDKKRAINAMLPSPAQNVPRSSSDVSASAADNSGSILSALRKERPTKSALPDASELFKEVQVSCHLQQKQRRQNSKRVSKTHSQSSQDSTQKNVHSTPKPAASDKTKACFALTPHLPEESKLLRHNKSSTASLLRKTMSDRVAGCQTTTSSLQDTAAKLGRSVPGKPKKPLKPRSAVKTSSTIITATPDRPKRLAARGTRRVLVEASPPVRRAGVSAPRLLQPKLARPGTHPPPLF